MREGNEVLAKHFGGSWPPGFDTPDVTPACALRKSRRHPSGCNPPLSTSVRPEFSAAPQIRAIDPPRPSNN